ncbi:MAG: MBOAT family protein [Oscillospiraceae bacterium]|jgi:alginate O-acetyltransferase complex protein AlgI|nr:MBOAT family protein [Oscillospiraceae bacterium]
MLFSSVTFLYYFFPLVLVLHFLMPHKTTKPRNYVLLLFSVVFYAWGEPKLLLLMLAQSFSGWFFGLFIERWRGKKLSKAALVAALVVGIGGLMFFKYADFFIENFNAATGISVPLLRLALPLGISFYTFQILSYDIDLYRSECEMQPNYFTFTTYVTLFPQLIAGPIVRYVDVAAELAERQITLTAFAGGARRFVIGLGKKVLIANVLGELVDICKTSGEHSVLNAWLYIIAYALHLYFDFSGYSDMAIGMGHMLGFKFLENFNYPYIARSITDLWRRWHMSLSSWFRDYVYIPLGGNRCSKPRQVFNILVVWFCTGFWHGAGWNFIVWGLYFAALLLLEKFVLGKVLDKLPRVIQHIYALVFILIGWTIFDAPTLVTAGERIAALFGVGDTALAGVSSLYYLRSYAVPLILATIGATPIVRRAATWVQQKRVTTVLEPLTVLLLLVLVTAYLVDGSFNPFIYFRF